MSKQELLNFSYAELAQYLASIGEKSFRATQIFEWLYQKGVSSFDEMKNLSKELWERLAKDFALTVPKVIEKQVSSDGTTKFLFELADQEKIETVLIPAPARITVCVSTQAGCKFGCKFCASGIGGWKRNLTCAEILTQILHVKTAGNGFPGPSFRRSRTGKPFPTHIVFMGVGEPLDNYENLLKAIRVINDPKGLNIGARRITVSTCGVIPKILALGKEGIQIELAISLHGYDNASRNVLMPVNKKYPFDDLIQACREYQKNYRRQITFEYILIKDMTCTLKAAEALKTAFKGLICKMNLIPYNPVREFPHKTPSRRGMLEFKNRLEAFGVHATIRTPRGRDVSAACGQLRHEMS